MKGNEFLRFAVVTGCLRIAKEPESVFGSAAAELRSQDIRKQFSKVRTSFLEESIFTGTNNFVSYSVLDDRFSRYFGFTQEEVDGMLMAADRRDRAEDIRSWYDGYVFGTTSLYCPWDVTSYVSALLENKNAKPKNYWKNTSHNGILWTFVRRTEFDVSDKFETLLNGGVVRQIVSDELTYDTLHESEDNLWSVLLMTGYLTKADLLDDGDTVELRIPNQEIANIFEETVVKRFNDVLAQNRPKQKELMEALWDGDEVTASKRMTDILFETISYHDYHENYYHAFMTGIISGLGYAVKSNQENGLGRSDIDVWEKRKKRGMLLEAKKSKKEEDMEKDALEGRQQIIDKGYLRGFSGFDTVVCYGISFFQKKALVRKLNI